MSARPRLESTVLGLMDVADQPTGQFVLVLEGLLGPRQAFSVDTFKVMDNVVRGYRKVGDEWQVVIAFPRDTAWGMILREYVTFSPLRVSARKSKLDQDALDAFGKELNPPDPKEAAQVPRPDLAANAGLFL